MSNRARFRERLEECRRVHVDAEVVALHLLADPDAVRLTRLLFESVRQERVTAQTSALTMYQLLAEPYRRGEDGLAEEALKLLTAVRGFDLVPVGTELAARAAQARARLGTELGSAVQIATALSGSSDLFLTRASGLRRVADMSVLDLADYE